MATPDPKWIYAGEVRSHVKTSLTDNQLISLIETVENRVARTEAYHGVSFADRDKTDLIIYETCKVVVIREPEAAGVGDYGNTTRATQLEFFQNEIDNIMARYEVGEGVGAIVVHTEPIPTS